MDTNNWRPAAPAPEPAMENGDWRSQLQSDSRQRIVNKIMETLKRHLPFSGQEGLQELKKIAMRFEEKIYTAATSQTDYLRKISLKMLTMETKSQNALPNPLAPNSAGNSNKSPDPGVAHSMQAQVQIQGQSLPVPLSANQPQARPQLLQQNIQNNLVSNGVQSSTGLPSAPPPVSGLTQTSMSNIVGQNPNLQSLSGVSQNSAGNSMGPGMPTNMFANSQRQMQGRQQGVPQQQQQQQQQQNNSRYLYQQQLHQQLTRQKLQQGNLQHPLVQSHVQQQQQQQQQPNLLQPPQLQSSQQSGMQTSNVMQPSLMQSSPLPGLQQNQPTSVQQSTQSLLQQHPQSVMRQQQQTQQASGIHQQQTPMMQQPLLQQQQQLMGQQTNAANMQQNQLTGQQNSLGDMQQQQQRLLGQQSNLQNLQQQQQQQQLMAPQSNLSGMHQQQLGPQTNVSTLQQQPLLGAQGGNSGMQTGQHPGHMMQQQKIPMHQSTPQNPANMLSSQGQQPQPQQPQQQLMSQIQSQPGQLQQQLGLQQQSNHLQRDMQQRIQAQGQAGGSLLQQQSVIDQQKQLYQSQRLPADTSSTSLDSTAQTGHANGGDWQEEVYQKIKTMKETYLPELNEMYQKIATKLQQHDSLPQQPKSDQLEKLKIFKTMLERIISFLQVSKNNILPGYKEKLGSYEKQIIHFLTTTTRPKKPTAPLQQGQLPQSHVQAMPQQQPQISQVQSHENPMNTQMQSMNMQGSVPSMQQNNMSSMQQNIMSSMAQNHMSSVAQNNMSSMQHNSLSSLSGVSTSQQNMNPLQPGSNMDAGQGNALNSLQQLPVGSMQQNPVSSSQQANINALSSQSGVNMLHPNNPLQANSNMLQHQHLNQQQHEHMVQSQQLKHRQMQQQLMQKQHMLQLQQAKQQLPAQMQTHQMSQLHQMNDVNELKLRQGMGVKSGAFQQHLAPGQRTAYPHQSMKPGSSFPISSPQLLQAASPQLPQHSSPQIDQQNILSSLTKAGTPLQSANSPFVVPSPSTPLAPSPMPGDSEKPSVSAISSLSNAGPQQTTSAQAPAPSLAIGTPGISASPLLAEFASPDGAHGSGLTTVSGKPSATEQPLERLIKAVKSMSPKALSASVSDIGSVVSMIDRIAGSAPGNGSRAAVGEDLVAMTNCRLQARNVITQDGMAGTRKMRRYTSAMPLNNLSSAGSVSDSFKQLTGPEASELESTATSSVKRPRLEANHVLLEEIRDINQRLIDTVVDISDEDVDITAAATAAEGGEGTVVKCSYSAVALSPSLKSQYASAQMSPIQPLRLLVPTNYPNCSPILLDKFPAEVSKEYEDLSVKAKSRFSISLRCLRQPMSLEAIARTWDDCARAVISEHAQQSGGGSFSSKYGTWEDCLSAA